MYVHAKQNYDSENFSRGNANYAHFATLQENKLLSTILFVSVIRDFHLALVTFVLLKWY